jgi:hypothetical protein
MTFQIPAQDLATKDAVARALLERRTIDRTKIYLNIWLDGDVRVDGFILIPKGVREQDFFELKTKEMIAITNATLYYGDGNTAQYPCIIVSRKYIKMLVPQ